MNQLLEYLNSKNITFKRSAQQIGVTQAYHKRGFGGEASNRWAIFQQNGHFSAIWMTFRTIIEAFESTELLNVKIT